MGARIGGTRLLFNHERERKQSEKERGEGREQRKIDDADFIVEENKENERKK